MTQQDYNPDPHAHPGLHVIAVVEAVKGSLALLAASGLELLGPDRVTLQREALTGSEDFAVMLDHCPGSYLQIGNGAGEGSCMVHNPGYDFNDDILPVGAAYWALLTERFLTP